MTVTKSISELGKATRFGANWPGKRCGATTRRGTECQRPAHKHNGRCGLHGGLSIPVLRLLRACRVSQKLMYVMADTQKISWKDSDALPKSGVGSK